MSSSLWPNLSAITPIRGMREMLVEAVGDISAQTNGDIQFYVDLVGRGSSGLVESIRYNCYLRAEKTGYLQLFFQVTTPSTGPWPAVLATPEGEKYSNLTDEAHCAMRSYWSCSAREQPRSCIIFAAWFADRTNG